MKKFLSLIFLAIAATSFSAPPTSTGPLTNAYNTTDQDFRGHKALNLDTSNLSIGGGGGGAGLTQITLNTPSILLSNPVNFSIVGTVASATMSLSLAPANSIFSNLSSGSAQPAWNSIAAFLSAAQLNNLDNTSDLNKPVSTATQSALDLKETITGHNTDVATINTAIGLKVNTSDFNTAMANKADLTSTTSALAGKASNADLTSGLATKQATWGLPPHNGWIPSENTDTTLFWVDPTSLGTTNQSYTDGVENTDNTFTSATAVFSAGDNGKTITGSGIPSSTTITYVSPTSITLSHNTTATATGVTFTILNRLNGTGGAGTVTNVASGNLSPLFTSSVASPSTTASISYTLSTALANTFFGNPSGSTLAPVYMSASQARNTLANGNFTGAALMSLTDASAIRYIKINANNSVTLDPAATFLTDIGAEPALGNPGTNGFVLSSTTGGVRSWIANAAPLTFTAPLALASNVVSMPSANAGASGYLLASDWSTFNSKENALTFSAPFSRATNTISLPVATAGANGYLASSDWIVFNNKVPSARSISTTPPLQGGGDLTANRSLSIPAATNSVDGYLQAVDFARMSKDINQVGVDTVATWTNGNTEFMETVGLTADRARTLPATSSYAEGSIIRYTDNVTTGLFGPRFIPGGADTLRAQNSSFWTGQPGGGYQPFYGAGFGGGSKTITFQKRGSDWMIYDVGGESLNIKLIQNSTNLALAATFNANALTSSRTITLGDFNAIIPASSDSNALGFIYDITTNGTFKRQPNPVDILPAPFIIGQAGVSIASGASFSVTAGLDTIFIAGTLNGPITVVLPAASAYNPYMPITIIDGSSSVGGLNTITLTAAGSDHINNTATTFVFDEINGKSFITSDGSANWYVPLRKVSNFPIQTLTANSGTFTIIPNSGIAGAQKIRMVLGNGVNNIVVPNPSDGMSLYLILIQPSSGAQGTVNLPTISGTPNGAGLVSLSSANSAIDILRGTYSSSDQQFLWEAPTLNETTSVVPNGAPSAMAVASFTSSTVNLTWTDNATNESSFDLERSNDGGVTFASIASLAPNTASFGDTGLTPATTYYYKVRAQNAGGFSAFSGTVNQATAAACSAVGDTQGLGTTTGSIFANSSAFTYLANRFVVGTGNGSICRIEAAVFYSSPSAHAGQFIKAEIRADNAGTPGSVLYTSTNSFSVATQVIPNALTAAAAAASPLSFTFSGVSLTQGTTYWMTLHSTDAGGTGQVFDTTGKVPEWNVTSSGTSATYKSGDGSSWSVQGSNVKNWMKTYH